MYYAIDSHLNPTQPDPDGPMLEIHAERIVLPGRPRWHSGARLVTAQPLPPIIEVEATPHAGWTAPPLDFFDGSISLISPRLVDVLRSNGVDNLELFPARIRYTTTGQVFEHFAFNLIGAVSAVDIGASKLESHDGNFIVDSSIHNLEVDLAKTRGLLMFRLAEAVLTVLVHKRIRDAVLAAGINTFTFVEPKDWYRA